MIPAPLGIGTLTLSGGEQVKGFICEPAAIASATDITGYGGWRAYLEKNMSKDISKAASSAVKSVKANAVPG
jgi:allophanate hydrolase